MIGEGDFRAPDLREKQFQVIVNSEHAYRQRCRRTTYKMLKSFKEGSEIPSVGECERAMEKMAFGLSFEEWIESV